MKPVVVNLRNLGVTQVTGVQRYTQELVQRLPQLERVGETQGLEGIRGHTWEQFALPTQLNGRLLWSPGNTGPLAVKRQVVTIHDLSALDHPENLSRAFAGWYGFLLPRLARRVQRVITDAEYTRQRLLEDFRLHPDQVVAIPLGVDPRFRPTDAASTADVRQRLEIPTPHYLLSLSSLEPRKNLSRLLQAWAKVVAELPSDLWLVIAGGRGKSLVFKDVSFDPLPPRVHLTGRVADPDLPGLYSGALAFMFPSMYEGFGFPPLEAMACGVPSIAGNRTSLPEVIGDAGLLFDPVDVAALSHNILKLVSDQDLRNTLAQKGLERVRQFSWEKTTKQTWQVLQDAAQD